MAKDERIKNGDELLGLYNYCTDASIANLCLVCKWGHVTLGPCKCPRMLDPKISCQERCRDGGYQNNTT